MNEKQQTMYNDLIKLVNENEAFTFKDHYITGSMFRIFNYRLASYTDFLEPHALECRGHMFEIDEQGNAIRLACMPMEKFFNHLENPFTENVSFSGVRNIMAKEDGSLISSYIADDKLMLKTKGSLESSQAIESLNWLCRPENDKLYAEIEQLAKEGFTVNMEWTSPYNRIVLGYEKEFLTVLNIRCNNTWVYFDKENIEKEYPTIAEYWVNDIIETMPDINKFIKAIPKMEGIEGFVIRLMTGQLVKFKTEWYLVRHKAKDSINAPKRLLEAIIYEAVDDIKVLFHDDHTALEIIDNMIAEVEPKYNHMIATVEKFHEVNKELDRKSYAIKAKGLDDGYMPLYMNEYIGRENDYKHFVMRNVDKFINVDDNKGEVSC